MFAISEIEPESPRYAADLLFIHGHWTRSWLWRSLAAGLAHRGWRCLLLDRQPSVALPTLTELTASLDSLLAQLARPVVVVGHDFGATLALQTTIRQRSRATIAAAPLLEGLPGYLPMAKKIWALLRGGFVSSPEATHPYLVAEPAPVRSALVARMVPEPASLVLRRLPRGALPEACSTPTLLIGLREDAVSSSAACAITAQGIGAHYLELPGSHWVLAEPRADAAASQIHRWIIRNAGADLLLLEGDEDLRDD